jgi:VIT1/CCC1 family predicted Fe2+/Mn2+ transporter
MLNGRGVLRSTVRQVVSGSLAAAVTFGVGALLGTQVS